MHNLNIFFFRLTLFTLIFLLSSINIFSQNIFSQPSFKNYSNVFSKKDSLRGYLNEYRSIYDVKFYDLNIIIDDKKYELISSYNIISFLANNNIENKIQIDLAYNMNISSIEFEGKKLNFEREHNAVYIYFNRLIKQDEIVEIKINYHGKPRKAVNPPWDGGFSWSKDKNGKAWIGVSCQGLGASTWWPCKDHQSDEPDSMRITYTVRSNLETISNGNLKKQFYEWSSELNDSVNVTEWFVSYPINNYNVTFYIGDYKKISDHYISSNDTLSLNYYVLSYNVEKAKKHFEQVKPMMSCFELYFGKYPFWNDGYALIETSYLGMEHQSAIAYGNNFLPGYYGNKSFIDNLEFDFIIIHETGHEWWGNSITTNDIADMWVHEGFCTYAEALYVECIYGYDKMLSYVNNQKNNVKNDKPIIGPYYVNKKGSNDMYSKGSLMLHTIRNIINDDDLWFNIIKDIAIKFQHSSINGADIINFINSRIELDLTSFFNQYLNYKDIPTFVYKIEKQGRNYVILYKWIAIKDFNMPIVISNGLNDYRIYPEKNWKELNLGSIDIHDLHIRNDLFYINLKKL